MKFGIVAVIALMALTSGHVTSAYSDFGGAPYALTDALLREVAVKMGDEDYFTYPSGRRVIKNDEEEQQQQQQRLSAADYEALFDPQETMIRDQEYLQHSSLWGHQYVAGGAGEGKQHLKPDGSMRNVHEIKSDSVLPAYCDPPNPCPVGYTANDECLSNFVNSAEFSRDYQMAQDCMCDTEHMFDCPSTSRQDEINALAQSIENEGITDKTLDKIMKHLQIPNEHKSLVAKKHNNNNNKGRTARQPRSTTKWQQQQQLKKKKKQTAKMETANPYLAGEKLPIVAKKGFHTLM